MMKRLSTLLTALLAVCATVSLTSCDEDDDIAYTLEGTWRGNMYVSSKWDGYTYDATYTELCFVQDPYSYSSGTGYWIDFYSANAPYQYIANHTEWTVRNGVIHIHLIEENSYVDIADYRLDDGRFDGTIYYGDQYVDFQMNHISSPNWGSYNYGYDYWYDYYAKKNPATRSTGATTDQPVRIFRTSK